MQNKLLIILITVLITISMGRNANAADFSSNLLFGYHAGIGFQLGGKVSDFAQGFPLDMQFSVGYRSRDAGNAADARKIFINDATNGDPEKSGQMWDFRLDFFYKVNWLSLDRGYIYFGPRYSAFTGNYKFIGGNEDFDITSNQWGLGLGLETYFPMSDRFDFIVSGGVDYYFSSTLSGHDTSYSPDGEDVNPRQDFTYDDAKKAVNQPELEFRIMIGVGYGF
jgi:hypothetical protein